VQSEHQTHLKPDSKFSGKKGVFPKKECDQKGSCWERVKGGARASTNAFVEVGTKKKRIVASERGTSSYSITLGRLKKKKQGGGKGRRLKKALSPTTKRRQREIVKARIQALSKLNLGFNTGGELNYRNSFGTRDLYGGEEVGDSGESRPSPRHFLCREKENNLQSGGTAAQKRDLEGSLVWPKRLYGRKEEEA